MRSGHIEFADQLICLSANKCAPQTVCIDLLQFEFVLGPHAGSQSFTNLSFIVHEEHFLLLAQEGDRIVEYGFENLVHGWPKNLTQPSQHCLQFTPKLISDNGVARSICVLSRALHRAKR